MTPTRSRNRRGEGLLAGILLSACAVLPSARAAADAFTPPRGIYILKVAGKPAVRPQARTYFGVQLLPDPKFVGLVGTVSGDTLTFPTISSYPGLADPERKCYVHVLTGNGRGFIVDIEEFRQTNLRCAQDLSGWAAPGTQVVIRPHPHLADLFGADNRFGLGSGLNADSADNVVAWDPQLQQERVYYYHSTRGRWEERGVEADASLAIMRFPYGLYIVRRSPGALRVSFSGDIAANPLLLPVRTGANVFSLPINLSRSLENLISTAGDYSVLSGKNSNKADLLTFEEPFTGIQRGPFYHSSRPASGGWREVGEGGGNGVTLDLLSTLILRREGPPGYVRAEGSLVPGSAAPVPPADPEPGETPLYGYLSYPRNIPPDVSIEAQASNDLQTWTPHSNVEIVGIGLARFQLPSGASSSFYRLRISLNF